MATFLLIRHGETSLVNTTFCGHAPGIPLNASGRASAVRLADAFASLRGAAVYSSPLERARETAQPLADAWQVPVSDCEGLIELPAGDWTGKRFAELEGEDAWRRFNAYRSGTRVPGGPMMIEVQARAVAALEALREQHGSGLVAAVTHGDIVRAILAHCAGAPLDLFQRFEVTPGSVSTVLLEPWGPRILAVNGFLPHPALSD
jgi:broad specificity phosphatase PhoE